MQEKNWILVTGASGFVGRRLVTKLMNEGRSVKCVVRSTRNPIAHHAGSGAAETIAIETLYDRIKQVEVFQNVSAVIHLAARVHHMKEQSADSLAEYRKVNVDLTRWIMQMAAEQGVLQFIYISTAKVNGEWNQQNPDGSVKPIREPVTSVPADAYALSKWEAEAEVRKISASAGMAFTIIRPPLVYGPEVGANFLRLLRLVERGIPLPLASVHNKRSMVFVDNLVDSIMTSILNPQAYGETFLVDDGTPLSTPQLIDQIARRMGKKPRLFRFPLAMLDQCGRAIGVQKVLQKVTGSFHIDGTKIRRKLGWTPPLTSEEGLQLTLDWYQSKKL